MIERKFIEEKMRDHKIKRFIKSRLKGMGFSSVELEKTPFGMKVTIHTSKPGLVIGRRGVNLTEMTETLRTTFNLESPQIEVKEVENPNLDPQIMAERIVMQLDRFGATRFKTIGYRTLKTIMAAGAVGTEIKISGKVPGKRANYWRFREGHLPKVGDIAIEHVRKGFEVAKLRPGIVGVKVSILTKDVRLPDSVKFEKEEEVEHGELSKEEMKELKEEAKENGNNKEK
jgi:small subunit ribosomal protein S3